MASPVVTFNYETWLGMFPQFRTTPAAVAQGYFLRAGLIFANDTSNPAFRSGTMETLFYLLTAHIAALSPPPEDQGQGSAGGPQLVGRLASASQGSVSVSAQWDGSGSPSESWYIQTQYGAEFWNATAQYRTARYVPRSSFVPTAIRPFGFRRW